jgi:hypothetical protein
MQDLRFDPQHCKKKLFSFIFYPVGAHFCDYHQISKLLSSWNEIDSNFICEVQRKKRYYREHIKYDGIQEVMLSK